MIKSRTPKSVQVWAVNTDVVTSTNGDEWSGGSQALDSLLASKSAKFMLVVELIPHGRPLPLDLPFAPWVCVRYEREICEPRFTINKQRLQGLLRQRINNSALALYSRRQINIDNINKRLFLNDLDTWSKNSSYYSLLLLLP